MKIGPVKITFAERQKKAPDQTEIGATGTSVFGGQLAEEEYNADLRGSKAIAVYDKMRRSDGRVKATLLACTLPIRAANWSVEPGSEDKRDVEIAAELEHNLLNGMTITWDSFLSHALLMLPFGFSIMEKVWEVSDGRVRFRKLAPRLPKTLSKWELDETGGLRGIEQYAWKGDGYQFLKIPAEKLLVFTNEKEGSNFEGVSILRSAYKHWYYKDNLYRIDGIAAERHAVGIPKFKHPSNADKKSTDVIDAIGERLYAQEQMFVRLAEGYDMTVEGLTGTVRDIMPSIEHHNREIPASILADFLTLGQGDTGSWALSRDKSSFFLMALESVISNITDTVNRYAVPQWVDYNYAGVEAYPKLACASLERRVIGEYATAVKDLVQSGIIGTDPGVEDTLRDLLKLPPRPEEARQAERKKYFTAAEQPRRTLTLAEQNIAFAEIEQVLNEAEAKIMAACQEVQKKQIAKLAEVAGKYIEKRQMDKLSDLDVPYRAEMAQAIDGVLMELYQFGRKQVKEEFVKQKNRTLAEPWPEPLGADEVALIKEYLRTRSKAAVNVLATKLKASVTFAALEQIKNGQFDIKALEQGMRALSDKELETIAGYSASEAFNFGRSAEAEKKRSDVQYCQYSALLDDDTCPVCEKMDGEEWLYDDPRTLKYARGNPDCQGKTRCRCLLVYVLKDETKAVK